MSQRPITGYFGSLLSGGENPDTTPTGMTQSEKQLSSPLDSQSGVSIGSDSTTGSDRTANQSTSNPDDSRGSGDSGELTVQPDHDTNDNLTQSENNGLHNRSLTEMLASAFQGETSPDNPSLVEQVVMLESQLIHETMQLDLERKDNTSMRNQVQLLQCELEQSKKRSDKQKQEIKRLLGENDNLRRDLSWYNGMRRFAETGTQPVIDLTDELQSTKVKLQSLKEHMVDITSRMIVALEESPDAERNGDDDDDTPFTLVTHSRRGRQLQRQQSARSRQVVPQPHPPNRRPEIPTPTQGQPIPVVCGVAGSHNLQPVHALSQQQRPSSTSSRHPIETVIGTSLTRGLGTKLNALGTDVTCYTYTGSRIPEIRSRIPHLLPCDNQPRRVVLQLGGNDAELQPSSEVTKQYDSLIGEIQQRCPRASIILSKIPPRKKNKDVLKNISRVNAYLQHRATEGDDVSTFDICPHDPAMFRKDLVHFNAKGCRVYANQMHDKLSNFTRFSPQMFR